MLGEIELDICIDKIDPSSFNIQGSTSFDTSLGIEECHVSCSILNFHNECYGKRSWQCLEFSDTQTQQKCSFEFDNFINEAMLRDSGREIFVDANGTLRIFCEIRLMKNDFVPIMAAIEDKMAIASLKDYGQLLESQLCSDVKLISQDGQEILAHKAILAARSPVFARMFEHDMREKKENVVMIQDIKSPVLKAVLQFIYAGTVDDLPTLAGEVMMAAEKYDIRSLKAKCELAILENLNEQNAVKNLIVVDLCNSIVTKERIMAFIIDNGTKMKDTLEYEGLEESYPSLYKEISTRMWPEGRVIMLKRDHGYIELIMYLIFFLCVVFFDLIHDSFFTYNHSGTER